MQQPVWLWLSSYRCIARCPELSGNVGHTMTTNAQRQDEPRDFDEIMPRSGHALLRPQLGTSRLGTYTALGAATGAVPLPWVPSFVAERIRGALVHDLTARHGLTLTPEARAVLIAPFGGDASSGLFAQAATFAVTRVLRRFGPLAFFGPVRTAVGTFVLGHLLERYLDSARPVRSVRIDAEEATRIRRAIDRAMIDVFTAEAKGATDKPPMLADDLRDARTQVIDGILTSLASAPRWLVRRLEAAFDEALVSVAR